MDKQRNFKYQGILVYSNNEELRTAFYETVCKDRILTVAPMDISKSDNDVVKKLKLCLENFAIDKYVKPIVFITRCDSDRYFNMKNYKNRPCFDRPREGFKKLGYELEFKEIKECPPLLRCLCVSDAEYNNIPLKMHEEWRRNEMSAKIFFQRLVNSVDTDAIIASNPSFKELAEVLAL